MSKFHRGKILHLKSVTQTNVIAAKKMFNARARKNYFTIILMSYNFQNKVLTLVKTVVLLDDNSKI
jgi:hypothetical protein